MTALAKEAPPEKVKQFKDSFVSHCNQDGWSVEMRQCVLDAHGQDDFEKCDGFMTAEQKASLAKESDGSGAGSARRWFAPSAERLAGPHQRQAQEGRRPVRRRRIAS